MISTHTPLARRDTVLEWTAYPQKISTHTPLARRDSAASYLALAADNFYSHAPCEA